MNLSVSAYLFLDFDGVLHPEPCYDRSQLFMHLPRLEAVLREFSEVSIIISSTWRDKYSFAELRNFFSADIAPRLIDVTPDWRTIPQIVEIIGYLRQAEIEAWRRSSPEPWRPWVAIDDKSYLFKPFLKNLLLTESRTGFDDVAEQKLRSMLINLDFN